MSSTDLDAYLARLNTTDNIRALFRQYGVNYSWLAMAAIMIATTATLMTGTIINVAIPEVMGTFGIGQDQAQWLSTAYLAASTLGMLLTSWIIGHLGMRNTVLGCMVLFMIGSVWGGFSPNEDIMIVARIIQGATSGVITPLGISLIFQLFPAGRQGLAMGVSSIGVILAPALGPVVGGALIDTLSWRFVFFLGVPFSLICIPLTMLFLPGKENTSARHAFDWQGLLLLAISLTSLLVALTNAEKEGWSSDYILSLFATAALTGAAFIFREFRCSHALLNLRVFGFQQFAIMSMISFIFGAGLYGSTYLVPLFLQTVQGFTATNAGLTMVPAGIVLAMIFPYSGRMADAIDHRLLISAGILVFAASFYFMTEADPDTSFWTYAWWLVLGRLGIGLVMPASGIAAMQGVPNSLLQQASGALAFIRQLGGVFGVNLMSVALERRTSFHRDALMQTQTSDNLLTMEALQELNRQLSASALTETERLGTAMSYLGQSVGLQAQVLGFQDSFWIAAVSFMLILIPVYWIRAHSPPPPAA